MSSSPSPFVVEPAGWRARFERLLDGVARQRIAVAVVAVLALAAAGALWLNAQPRAAADGAAQGGDGAASGQPAGATIAVDVVGRVQHPGLVRLPQGSRVLDAIEAAGGTAPGAELEAVNLARKLVDGELIRIPRHGEAITAPADGGLASGTAQPGGTGAAGGAGP